MYYNLLVINQIKSTKKPRWFVQLETIFFVKWERALTNSQAVHSNTSTSTQIKVHCGKVIFCKARKVFEYFKTFNLLRIKCDYLLWWSDYLYVCYCNTTKLAHCSEICVSASVKIRANIPEWCNVLTKIPDPKNWLPHFHDEYTMSTKLCLVN